jgi:transposase
MEQEQAFLEPFLGLASTGGVIVVAAVRQALQARLGRPVALASVYNLLHRHGWRKVVPGKVHPKADPEAQQEWKKNPCLRRLPSPQPRCLAPHRCG